MRTELLFQRKAGIFLAFFTLCCSLLSAQDLRTARASSHYTYIFKLTSEQLLSCYRSEEYFQDLEKNLTTPLDSFPTDSGYHNSLSPGAYAYLKAVDNFLECEINFSRSFDVNLLNNQHDLSLAVTDLSSGKSLSNATIKLGKKIIPYDSSIKAYSLPFSNRTGLLSVSVNDETIYYSLHHEGTFTNLRRSVKSGGRKVRLSFARFYYRIRYSGPGQEIIKSSYRFRYAPRYSGYIAFNKPKYLPGDTLKVKAFFLKNKKKPLDRDLKAFICKKDQPYNARQITWLHPETKGAYIFQYALGDSLKLNTYYTVFFRDKKNGNIIMGRDFLMEDYQLNETSYEIRTSKNEFKKGEPVLFFVNGRDANGMTLLDARIKIRVKTNTISRFISDSVLVPDLIWEHEQKLDPIGETKITLPDSLLPSVVMDLKIEALFNNSNNESHDSTFTISYAGEPEYIATSLQGNKVTASFIKNGKETEQKGTLIKKKTVGFEEIKEITFPYSELLDFSATKYIFSSGDLQSSFDASGENAQVVCRAIRTADSVLISLSDPRGIPIEYSLYRNGKKLIAQGICTDLVKKLEDRCSLPYTFHYHYIWNGNMVNEEKSLVLFRNNLNVKIDQPEKIVPGQKTNIHIKVTDTDRNPVSGVNITAGALNNQFNDARIPGVPYLGKSVRSLECANGFSLSSRTFSITKPLTKRWKDKWQLDTMPYYQFIYPKGGIRYNYDSIGIANAQVSPYVYENGAQVPVYLIYIDHRPVYWYEANNADDYSFTELPGYHRITLRTHQNSYEIDSVLLKKGYKLDLSICPLDLPAKISNTEMPDHFSERERDIIHDATLYLNHYYNDKTISLWQNDKVYVSGTSNYYRTLKLFGFLRDSIHCRKEDEFTTHFIFEPGYDYSIFRNLIKMRSIGYSRESAYLSENQTRKGLGLLATTLPPLEKKQYNSLKRIYTYNPYLTGEGRGTYRFEYTGDSTISLIRVAPEKEYQQRFVEGYTKSIRDLEPGNYTITLITPSHYFLTRHNVKIKANCTTFERFGDGNYVKGNPHDISLTSQWDTIITPRMYLGDEKSTLNGMTYLNYNGPGGVLKLTISDKKTKESLPFANAVVYSGSKIYATGTADFDGNIVIKPIPPGRYSVKVIYIGYQTNVMNEVQVQLNKITYLDVSLFNDGVELQEVAVETYKVPLIDPDTKSGAIVSREYFQAMANKSINAVVSTSAGVYQSDLSNVYIRGARSYSANVFIDGERAIGTSNIPQSAVETSILYNDPEPMFKSAEAPQIRSHFSDYGYWKPNLITNDKGEVSFEVTFPQNITTWKAYALAMDDKKRSGAGYKETRAFKNVMTTLSVPRFLIEGDSANAIGKTLNYMPELARIKTKLTVNTKIIDEQDTLLKNALIKRLCLTTDAFDTVKVSYSSFLQDGSNDGEEKIIPVLPIGSRETIGNFYVLNGDTSLSLTLTGVNNEVYALDNPLDFLLKELDDLKNYPYWCMEQTASKLNALLMEKQIKDALKRNFKGESEIQSIMKKLEKGQKENGSWGWWEDSPENVWMTAYISTILAKAEKAGYHFKKLKKAIEYLAWSSHTSKGNELLTVLNSLSELKLALPYNEYYKRAMSDSLSLYQKLMWIKILQENELPYSIELIEKEKKQTMMGGYFWGNAGYDWYECDIKTTLLAYRILQKKNPQHPYLLHIQNYFLEMKRENRWRNTVETASILETILPDLVSRTSPSEIKSSLQINGSSVSSFPYSKKIGLDEKTIHITKKGIGPVFLTAYHSEWNKSPDKKTDVYEIKTHFEVNGKKTDSLKAGTPTEMVIDIYAKKSAEYIMINVPIPAGCSYDDNKSIANGLEVHREYFKNKTTVFCESMPIGHHIFRIKLQPRFTGSYTMNPVTTELMYFPVFFGRNSTERVKIH